MFINDSFNYISVRPTAVKLKNDPDITILLSFNARQTILYSVLLKVMKNSYLPTTTPPPSDPFESSS